MKNPLISPKDLITSIQDEDVIILDVSPSSNKSMLIAKYPDSMIPGSFIVDLKSELSFPSAPFPNTFPSKVQLDAFVKSIGLSRNSKVIVYDNLGIYTAARAWWILKTIGVETVQVLNGGLSEWVEEGGEVISRTSRTRPGNGSFTCSIDHKSIKSYDDIQRNLSAPSFKIIDARSEGRFSGTSPEPRIHLKSGSIDGSSNIPFKMVLDNGKLKSSKALESIFKSYTSDEELVFSCGSGLTACIVHLAASTIRENKMSIYDGSWTEWAERSKLFVD